MARLPLDVLTDAGQLWSLRAFLVVSVLLALLVSPPVRALRDDDLAARGVEARLELGGRARASGAFGRAAGPRAGGGHVRARELDFRRVSSPIASDSRG